MRRPEYNNITPEIAENRQKQINRTFNRWRKQRSPRDKNEYMARTDTFFKTIDELEIVPSDNLYALALGIHRSTLFRHKNGINCSPEVAELTRSACDLIEVLIQQAATDGRINAIYAIWTEKSRYGYSDQAGQSEQERMTQMIATEPRYRLPSDIARKWLTDTEIEELKDNEEPLDPDDYLPDEPEYESTGWLDVPELLTMPNPR